MPTLINEDLFDGVGEWTNSAGTPTIGTSPHPTSAANSLQINPAGAAEYVFYPAFGGTPTRVVAGFWLYLNALPAAESNVAKIDFGSTECWMRCLTSGELYIAGDGTPTMAPVFSGVNLSIQTWYWINMLGEKANNPWEFHLKVGATVTSTSGAAAAANFATNRTMLGTTQAHTYTFYYGHVKYGSASSDQDWWPEPTAAPPSVSAHKNLLTLGVG